MLSIELAELGSVRVGQACRILGKEPFSGSNFRVKSLRVFFSIHAWFLCFESSENPNRGNQAFSCLYQFKKTGDQREVSLFLVFLATVCSLVLF
jgi:hypothetical protein